MNYESVVYEIKDQIKQRGYKLSTKIDDEIHIKPREKCKDYYMALDKNIISESNFDSDMIESVAEKIIEYWNDFTPVKEN